MASFVAEVDGQIVGHILFSRMTVATALGSVVAISLAPMAVLLNYLGRQIGSHLVHHGLAELRARGERIVIVLGHEEYYPRFGFSPEKARYLASPFPPQAFIALELSDDAAERVHGDVRYPAAFGL